MTEAAIATPVVPAPSVTLHAEAPPIAGARC